MWHFLVSTGGYGRRFGFFCFPRVAQASNDDTQSLQQSISSNHIFSVPKLVMLGASVDTANQVFYYRSSASFMINSMSYVRKF